MKIITCIAPVNIAVIKYWGKRDEDLILPINDSISSTLSLDYMFAKTTVMISPDFKENKIWLNCKEESFDNPRLFNCLKEVKKRAELESSEMLHWNIHICSENNFPTAAGLASSAAGYACLVFALSVLYKVKGDITAIARRGSGSACRSIYGGWVQWHKGLLDDGTDSYASQIVSASHWPEMRILVLVVNEKKKKISSTTAMKSSVATSQFLKYRSEKIVPARIEKIIEAIKAKDFELFAKLTMQDSNQFHSVCLDTYPPCVYMNDISHAIVELVHAYNEFCKQIKVAYTFDAGPNACLYMLEKEVPQMMAFINYIFPTNADSVEYYRGIQIKNVPLCEELKKTHLHQQTPGMLKYIIHTKVGEGAKSLDVASEHLLNESGTPKIKS